MNSSRFQVLPNSPLTVWDNEEEKTIHLGSTVEATELAELLNGLCTQISQLKVANRLAETDRDICLAELDEAKMLLNFRANSIEEDHY